VSDADQVQALVDFAVERFGGLDIMFNDAGIGCPLKRSLPDVERSNDVIEQVGSRQARKLGRTRRKSRFEVA
jgi:NAD(P)-dependent dehydrogenase (short-subunit alcohol dehydrogenase family)